MKILVLGGTGAMGASLVQILAENTKNEVYVTSRSSRESFGNVHYVQGNAHETLFLVSILKGQEYDAIVDFMVYAPDEFSNRVEMLLSATKQYMFLSSSRVYADNGNKRIAEESPRLLDVCTDAEYLATNEYALAKAREENVLFESGRKNWTIIRPYITYNDNRLQLGVFEKENWLYRALNHKTIVFPKDIAEKYTTLTYGYDVAKVMAELIGNKKAFGQTFHIATEQTIKWADVLEIYLNVIEKELGYRPKVYMPEVSKEIGEACGCRYQIICDRLFNRVFSSDKVKRALGHGVDYTDVCEGLTLCLSNFIRGNNGADLNGNSVRQTAYFDKLTNEKTDLTSFSSIKRKIAYLVFRYMPISLGLLK